MFYVYILIDPRTTLPFYVGKGDRAYAHGKKSQMHNELKEHTIANIRAAGHEHEVQLVYENLNECTAYSIEIELIRYYGRIDIDDFGILTNRSVGGGGNSGWHHTNDAKNKISEANTGKTTRTGFHLSEDHKQKISAANTGTPRDNSHLLAPDVIEKRRQSLIGLTRTDETKEKMSNAHKGKTASEYTRAKMSKAQLGKKRSAEHCQRMSSGKMGKNNPMYGKKWYTDGINSKQYKPGDEPTGFVTGRKIKGVP